MTQHPAGKELKPVLASHQKPATASLKYGFFYDKTADRCTEGCYLEFFNDKGEWIENMGPKETEFNFYFQVSYDDTLDLMHQVKVFFPELVVIDTLRTDSPLTYFDFI